MLRRHAPGSPCSRRSALPPGDVYRRTRPHRPGHPRRPSCREIPGAVTADGIVQAPNRSLSACSPESPADCGITTPDWCRRPELGYEQGGLTPSCPPGPGPGDRGGPGWISPRCERRCSTCGPHAGSSSPTCPACATPRSVNSPAIARSPNPAVMAAPAASSAAGSSKAAVSRGTGRMGRPGRRPRCRRRAARHQRRRHPPVRLLRRPQGRDERQHADPPQRLRRARQ